MKKILLAILLLITQSCANNFTEALKNSKLSKSLNDDYSAPTNQLNKTKELLDGASITFPTLTATGYAVVSTQPGQSIEQRRLMATQSRKNVSNERTC